MSYSDEFIHPKDQIVDIMRRIYGYGMTTTSGGNLSILDSEGNIWISPGGVDKGSLTRDDIVRIKPDGTIEGRHKPSSEYPFHKALYSMRPDVKAILHAHPPALVSFSVAGKIPETSIRYAYRLHTNHTSYAHLNLNLAPQDQSSCRTTHTSQEPTRTQNR